MLSFPTLPNSTIEITDLTHSVVDGNGVFDKLMKAVNAHLQQEWQQGRIKGTEYSTVYLSAIEHVLRVSLEFVLTKDKATLELELMKLSKEKETAQIALLEQQTANLVLEAVNIPKQGILLDKQAADLTQATLLKTQQTANAVIEGTVLTNTAAKVTAEKNLLDQRKVTETAQVDPTGVNVNSVIGRQTALVEQQREGFIRDAEQKAAKIMADALAVQMTLVDELGAIPDNANLAATDVGAMITKLAAGVGVTV